MKQKVITRTFSLLLMLLAVSLQISAQTTEDETVNYLLVTDKGGTETAFALDYQPVIKLADGSLTVNISAETKLTVALDDVLNYKFVAKKDIPTAIKQVIDKAVRGNMSVHGGVAYFTELKGNARVSVYTVDGKQLTSVTADGNGNATIDLNTLGNGKVYILRMPNAGYKISKK